MAETSEITAERKRPSLDDVVDQFGIGVVAMLVVAIAAVVAIPDEATMPSLLLPVMSVGWFVLAAGVAWAVAWWKAKR
jgi:hypothetical protein